ncbi:MAG: hypothetical protein ACI828_001662 [Flavobacteriales bacterium]|jgi:hypothetical protein
MNKFGFFLALTFILSSCKSKKTILVDTSCESITEIKYDKVRKNDDKDLIVTHDKKSVIVLLEGNFNDSIRGYVNGNLIFKDLVKTEESLGTSFKYFFYDYSEGNFKPKIKVEMISGNDCIEFEVIEKYKLIHLYYYKKARKWTVVYSNVFSEYE